MAHKFCNVTNGVTLRRFVALGNARLSRLITETIGERWLTDLDELRGLEPLANDRGFQDRWRHVKLANKQDLAGLSTLRTGVDVSHESLFDIQVKRIHGYKRQHLNVPPMRDTVK